MKKFWITVSIVAIAAAGIWQFGNRIPYAQQVPYLSKLIKQPAAHGSGKGDGSAKGGDQQAAAGDAAAS
ncbi:hypothetical protein, partial [Chryseobacterium sp. SIMBA_028]|uniref:hypothetical protein n=1 Tax=Chryseobacterium sp. SIMBA_028 TaxID=3085771 RepID=UPI00397CF473